MQHCCVVPIQLFLQAFNQSPTGVTIQLYQHGYSLEENPVLFYVGVHFSDENSESLWREENKKGRKKKGCRRRRKKMKKRIKRERKEYGRYFIFDLFHTKWQKYISQFLFWLKIETSSDSCTEMMISKKKGDKEKVRRKMKGRRNIDSRKTITKKEKNELE